MGGWTHQQVEEIVLAAFAKGKGKGKKGGGGGGGPPYRPTLGQGGGKGGGGKGGAGGGKGGFTGACWHCGGPHRRSECPAFTAHLKGGGAKGGGNPGSLNWFGESGSGGLAEEDANADAWAAGEEGFSPVLNGELYALSAEVPTSNSFAALATAEEEAEDARPAAVPASASLGKICAAGWS